MSSGVQDPPANATRTSMWSRATTRIITWQNWKLPVKIAAVVLVPVIFAIVLGVLQIRGQITEASNYEQMDRVVSAGRAVRTAVDRLQDERSQAAEFLARGQVTSADVRNRFADSDRALAETQRLLRAAPDSDAVRYARQETDRQSTELEPIRRLVLGGNVDPGITANSYTELIDVMLALDRTLISQISSSELVATATTIHELAKISEEVQLQQALVLTGLAHENFTSDNLARIAASEARRTAAVKEFRAAADPEQRIRYDRLYTNPEVPARETSVQLAMAEQNNTRSSLSSHLVSSTTWKNQSHTAAQALTDLQAQLDRQLHHTAFTLQDTAGNLAGLESVLLLSALLVAGAIVVVMARHLLGSLDVLRRSALDTANHQLPNAVADIRAGHAPLAVDPVPVSTTDEVGEVARAFDDVHAQAVTLATEQAELRRSYSDSFINVSRRSQSLLERQLRLFEQLERDEEDPDQLATLFQLDHLATRMRRNNENLMVLSGADLARRFTRPTTPADLLRAAVSEIEHYPRVTVQQLPDTKIVGYVANDLVRLLAELLDNAANFSAPQTQVVVSGQREKDGSLRLDIDDEGIGMNPAELAEANQRLTSDEEIKQSTSRRMGLFVVGRLARRHGIRVELAPGQEGTGVRVSMTLRPELLVDDVSLPAPRTNGVYRPDHDDDTLIRQFDWEAAEQDAISDPPTHNGFHLFRGDGDEVPNTAPADLFATQEISTEPPPAMEVPSTAESILDELSSAWFQERPDGEPELLWPDEADGPNTETFAVVDLEEKDPSSDDADDSTSEAPLRDWSFASDEGRQRAEEVAAAEPTDFTSAGLPQRIPLANLVAGSADRPDAEEPRPTRDANLARGRLASFQAGVQRGRHRLTQAGQAASSAVEGPATAPPDAPEDPAPAAVEETSDEAAQYTPSGLPRRTPRAQLVSGLATDSATAPPRDADVMRGRLASFQRGVREGKHSLRDPQPSTDETR
ncbi:nitrate- and nitrite sensing domain-containing protein [Saccharopolyspora sp. TS4A08]|uniref:histidine kinase n=1 Tax=Saccharopolyspora ipomoeae TaxID=3042027 RepID=A0ABT6PL82_9PSEU|nr:nitrate- and nitrite sensing domain-containing protein [Saccharopolyspora sp. TS4A08]MDI2028739.1 nitrate- and nitrite sensing domain-containing protein [Saccharopolyspora sp. TS4A08]